MTDSSYLLVKGKGFTYSLLKLQNSNKANYQLMNVIDYLGKTWDKHLSRSVCPASDGVSFPKAKSHMFLIPRTWGCEKDIGSGESAEQPLGHSATEPCMV